MKKLTILIAMLMATSAYADMDRVCMIVLSDDLDIFKIQEKIEENNCERNNVLEVVAIGNDDTTTRKLLLVSNQFCRFDRNRDIERNVLSCILYSTKPRRDK
tara:strand:+ start:122 stop:427 length:306 start_codon:yes stop_codon:yes gene_type:complete